MKPFMKYIVAGFLAGLLVGGIAGRFVSPWAHRKMGPEKKEARILKRFTSELKLSAEQEEKVRAVLQEKHRQMEPLFKEVHSKFDLVRNSTADEIRKVLTPEQLPKFEAMHKRFEERRNKHRSHTSF